MVEMIWSLIHKWQIGWRGRLRRCLVSRLIFPWVPKSRSRTAILRCMLLYKNGSWSWVRHSVTLILTWARQMLPMRVQFELKHHVLSIERRIRGIEVFDFVDWLALNGKWISGQATNCCSPIVLVVLSVIEMPKSSAYLFET